MAIRSAGAVVSFANTRTVDVNGAALAYREQGEGEPVVFVHGSASDLRTWAQRGAGFPPMSEDDVRRVAASTLLMAGERSPAYAPRLTDRLQQLLPNAERVEIAGASHVMHEENAAAVNRAILEFLSRTAGDLTASRQMK
jgi:pimeloyl-ACP methyl ester carboxylesterase